MAEHLSNSRRNAAVRYYRLVLRWKLEKIAVVFQMDQSRVSRVAKSLGKIADGEDAKLYLEMFHEKQKSKKQQANFVD